MKPTVAHDTDRVARLADLTRRYARYSRTAGGLGSVLGGALVLATYLVGALVSPSGLLSRLALAATPILWIVAKEVLRSRYYQQLGRVTEPRTTSERRWHLAFTLFTAAVSLAILGVILWTSRSVPRRLLEPAVLGYLAYIAAMPLLVWRFMPTPLEFIAGVFLVAQAALALVGVHYQLGDQLQAPIAALVLIVLGLRQHREFLALHRELQELQPAR